MPYRSASTGYHYPMQLYLLLGAVLAVVYILLVRTLAPGPSPFATGLLIAAAIYVVAALFLAPEGWLQFEGSGLLAYFLPVAASRKFGFAALAVGWLLHPLWDYYVHITGPGADWMPVWYAWLCVSFDLVVGLYCGYRWWVGRAAP